MELTGDQLASVAQDLVRGLDPERKGLHLTVILEAIEASGVVIKGKPRITLGTALNNAQHRFDRAGESIWAWKDTQSTEGLSGTALLDEAYLVAKRIDPGREGIHYEALKAAILEEGARIAGGNPGKTMFSVLDNAKTWFEWVGDGRFRWR